MIKCDYIHSGHKTSCGCAKKRKSEEYKKLIGKTYNKLTITDIVWDDKSKAYMVCDCICGTKGKKIEVYSVLNNGTMSCGCSSMSKGE